MRDYRKKKIGIIFVKSLSRFKRYALEAINQIRRLEKIKIFILKQEESIP